MSPPSSWYPLQLLAFAAVHLGSLAVIGASAWVFGETLLGRFGPGGRGPGRRALATALGLGLLAEAMFAAGVLGLFDRGTVLALLAAAHLICWRTWRDALGEARRFRPHPSRIALGLALAAPFAVLALYPPTGWDATTYHLPYVETFVDTGRLAFAPGLRYPVFPQVVEMHFLLAFFLSGDVAAKLTQTLAAFLTAALIVAWGRRAFSRRAGIWAAALWLGTPLVVWLSSLAYVDVGLTLFVTAALYSWERWRDGGDERWLWLSGAFAGLAAGTKYLGLFFCGALAAATALHAWKLRSPRPVAAVALAAALVMAPWYLRIYAYTGNPVFPFYAPLFGDSEWTSRHDEVVFGEASEAQAGGVLRVAGRQAARVFEGLGFLLTVPWTGIFHRQLFHFQAPLTPLYLVLLPLAGPLALAVPRARRLVALVALYGLFWLAIEHDLRFLLPVFPALNLALAAGLERWRTLAGSRAAVAVTILLFAPGFFYAGYKMAEWGPPPATEAARSDFLSRRIPGYAAIRTLNEIAGGSYTVYALFAEQLHYYADGRFLGDWFGPTGYRRILRAAGNSRALHAELRGLGADYFLVRYRNPRARLPLDRGFRRRFHLVWRDAEYALYRLDGRGTPAGRPLLR